MIVLTTKGKTYMKNFMIAAALGTATLTTPAMANDFGGLRAEVTAGLDDATRSVDADGIVYGAALGYDLQFGKVVIGAEVTGSAAQRPDLGAGARLGYVLNKNVLAYGRVGYTDLELPQVCTGTRTIVCRDVPNLDGFTVGAGIEAKLQGPLFTKVEYRYTDFAGNAGRHGALVGVGIKF
jgi:outer membrane immunogenic protein